MININSQIQSRVRNAVVKGWITAGEYNMITDEIYEE